MEYTKFQYKFQTFIVKVSSCSLNERESLELAIGKLVIDIDMAYIVLDISDLKRGASIYG